MGFKHMVSMGMALAVTWAPVQAQTAVPADPAAGFKGDPLAGYFKARVDEMGGLVPAQEKARKASDPLAEKCTVCHGADGNQSRMMNSTVVPNLAQQQPLYTFKQLAKFRSRERNHPVMQTVAKNMDDQEFLFLSLRFSSLPLKPYSGPDLEVSAEAGKTIFTTLCQHCHGADGMGMGAIPRLAGQNASYIVNTLTNFREQGPFRVHAGMQTISAKLTDSDIASLAMYVATIRGTAEPEGAAAAPAPAPAGKAK